MIYNLTKNKNSNCSAAGATLFCLWDIYPVFMSKRQVQDRELHCLFVIQVSNVLVLKKHINQKPCELHSITLSLSFFQPEPKLIKISPISFEVSVFSRFGGVHTKRNHLRQLKLTAVLTGCHQQKRTASENSLISS